MTGNKERKRRNVECRDRRRRYMIARERETKIDDRQRERQETKIDDRHRERRR